MAKTEVNTKRYRLRRRKKRILYLFRRPRFVDTEHRDDVPTVSLTCQRRYRDFRTVGRLSVRCQSDGAESLHPYAVGAVLCLTAHTGLAVIAVAGADIAQRPPLAKFDKSRESGRVWVDTLWQLFPARSESFPGDL
jgi:hypothetical protein